MQVKYRYILKQYFYHSITVYHNKRSTVTPQNIGGRSICPLFCPRQVLLLQISGCSDTIVHTEYTLPTLLHFFCFGLLQFLLLCKQHTFSPNWHNIQGTANPTLSSVTCLPGHGLQVPNILDGTIGHMFRHNQAPCHLHLTLDCSIQNTKQLA